MVIPILIDTSSIAEQFSGITKESLDTLCDNVAKALTVRYAQALTQEANNTLHKTKKRYIRAITVIDSGRMEGTVLLDYSKDRLVKMIEEGAGAFDEKKALLSSSKAKIGKNGKRYITVPFRMATPGAVADSDVFTTVMPQEVYDVVKKKDTNIANGRGTRSSGLMVKELPAQFQSPKVRAAVSNSKTKDQFDEYKHKSSIYAGLIKTKDAVTGQNTYNTFRRVSDNSDKLAFVHPGIQRYALIGKALANFNHERELAVQLNNELAKLGLQ